MSCTIIIPTIPERKEFLRAAVESTVYQHGSPQVLIESGGTLSQNLNRGLKRATGKWIKILADDDLLVPYTIDKLISFAEDGGFDWVYGDAKNFSDLDDFPIGWTNYQISICYGLRHMLMLNTIHGGTTIYKKEILFEIGGYDESIDTAEEYDLHLNLLKHGYSHAHFKGVVYEYRLHQDNKSMSMGAKLKAERKEYINKYIRSRYV